MTVELRKESFERDDLVANFEAIEREFNLNAMAGFEGKLLEFNISRAVTAAKIRHPFTFVPTDVIVTLSDQNYYMIFHVEDFTETHLSITTSGPVLVRCLMGRFTQEAVKIEV